MRQSTAVLIVSIAQAMLAAQLAHAGPVSYGGGDGGSFDAAIIVTGAMNEEEGILAEIAYVAKRHPDWRLGKSALMNKVGRTFDSNSYSAKDGSEHVMIFDVTGFFGKM